MGKSKPSTKKAAPRRKAAVKPRTKKAEPPVRCTQDTKRLIAELESHQVELETQNEELRQTQEKLSESNRALRGSEDEFRALFELSAVGLAEVSIATKRFLRANRKFCEITGYTREELTRLTIAEITHPDDRDRDFETIRRALLGETTGW